MSSFNGLAEIYERSRHGYPLELRDHLVQIGALATDSNVVDLGAGTGQLALMAAGIASDVVAVDPESDMVELGQQVTKGHPGIRWVLGSDRDVCELLEPSIDLVLIGNAFHHMNQPALLSNLDSLIKPNGAVTICSTSIPVWLHQTDWSRALRQQLGQELRRPVGQGGTPDHDSDIVVLRSSPFSNIETWVFARNHERSVESIVGEVVSSASGAIDERAAERLMSTLEPYLTDGALDEHVRTTALIAHRRAGVYA